MPCPRHQLVIAFQQLVSKLTAELPRLGLACLLRQPPQVKDGVVEVCVDMQEKASQMSRRFLSEMGRHYYVTPTSYLELINTFKSLLHHQRHEVLELKTRYENGLTKLLDTASQVNAMQVRRPDRHRLHWQWCQEGLH